MARRAPATAAEVASRGDASAAPWHRCVHGELPSTRGSLLWPISALSATQLREVTRLPGVSSVTRQFRARVTADGYQLRLDHSASEGLSAPSVVSAP